MRIPKPIRDFVSSVLSEIASLDHIREFKSLAEQGKYADAVRYATVNLDILGTGTSRSVATVDDDTVIKFAIAKSGFAQNSIEADPALQSKYGDIVAKTYSRASDNFWIEVDRVSPAQGLQDANKWAELIGASSYGLVAKYISLYEEVYDGFNDEGGESIAAQEEQLNNRYPAFVRMSKNPFVQKMIEFMIEFGIASGDLLPRGFQGKHDSIGFTSDGRPVIIDYGMTNDVWDEHYGFEDGELPKTGDYEGHRAQIPVENRMAELKWK